ncbi:MAG: dTMP kinase [Candidatus Pelagibacter sp.]|nr:dTMP kinase [Candidatus Pelagibacter sp.]OUW11694.1 MAG: dTMP kinase [Candidatus Pelagibacter sp. TMED166]|tara:strand:+ start:2852 stop:3466 length:615 start_codon:yes stop_codon:yes gene_type:complete
MKKFITFEGIDASGKSTQIKIIYKLLKKKNKKVFITREPGGTILAEKIRNLIINSNFTPLTELMLFYAARYDHFKKINYYLKKKYIVLCDRYIHSTYAYQHHEQKIDKKLINFLQNIIGKNSYPDLTFLIDLPSVLAKKRIKLRRKSKDKFDNYDLKKINIIRKAFLKEKKRDKKIFLINGALTKNQVTNQIIKILIKKKILNG